MSRRDGETMSRILIAGSDRVEASPTPATTTAFREVCRAIGAELARRGHEIVVCSTSEASADYWAAVGANHESKKSKPAIVAIFLSDSEVEQVRAGENPYDTDQFANIVANLRVAHGGWFSTYAEATRYSDGLIAVSGSPRGTGGAIYIALSKATPVLAIPALGGFAGRVWDEFKGVYATLPASDFVDLVGKDPVQIALAATRSIKQLIDTNPFPAPRRGARYIFLPLLIGLFAASWIFLAFGLSSNQAWVPYVGAVPAALAGLMLRYANDDATRQVAYAGQARVYKDVTRVFGTLLGLAIVVNFAALQLRLRTADTYTTTTAWLGVLAFGAGLLIEESTGLLTKSLNSAMGTVLKGNQR